MAARSADQEPLEIEVVDVDRRRRRTLWLVVVVLLATVVGSRATWSALRITVCPSSWHPRRARYTTPSLPPSLTWNVFYLSHPLTQRLHLSTCTSRHAPSTSTSRHSPSEFTLSINSLHDGVVVLLVLVVVLLLFLVVVVAVVEAVLLFHCLIYVSRLHSSDASNLVNW